MPPTQRGTSTVYASHIGGDSRFTRFSSATPSRVVATKRLALVPKQRPHGLAPVFPSDPRAKVVVGSLVPLGLPALKFHPFLGDAGRGSDHLTGDQENGAVGA